MVLENADALQHVLTNLESLSRIDGEARQRRAAASNWDKTDASPYSASLRVTRLWRDVHF